jgi:hypothetical protein
MPSGADLNGGVLRTAFSRNRSGLFARPTTAGEERVVEGLDQRNERRSPTIGGTGGVVIGGQNLIRPRGTRASRDDDSADATVVVESTTQ